MHPLIITNTLTKEQASSIFSTAEWMLNLHVNLLGKMKARLLYWQQETSKIGDLFIEIVSHNYI